MHIYNRVFTLRERSSARDDEMASGMSCARLTVNRSSGITLSTGRSPNLGTQVTTQQCYEMCPLAHQHASFTKDYNSAAHNYSVTESTSIGCIISYDLQLVSCKPSHVKIVQSNIKQLTV